MFIQKFAGFFIVFFTKIFFIAGLWKHSKIIVKPKFHKIYFLCFFEFDVAHT